MNFSLIIIAALVTPSLVLAGPDPDVSFVAEAHQDAQKAVKRQQTIHTTLTAMADGPRTSGDVAEFLKSRNIFVYTADQMEPAKYVFERGYGAIVLSNQLPAVPRVYGPFIAYQAARLAFTEMPASSEREYMITATAAHVFQELGGDFKALPNVDGNDVPSVQQLLLPWTGDVEAALISLGAKANVPALYAIRNMPQDVITTANRVFVQFLLSERDARRLALNR